MPPDHGDGAGRNGTPTGETDRLLAACGPESQLHDRYVRAAGRRLNADPAFREAAREWAAFVRDSHGDVFARLERDPEALFVAVLYYDFVIDRLRAAAERALGVALAAPDTGATRSTAPVAFGRLHDRTAGSDVPERPFDGRLPADELSAVGPDDLRSLYRLIVPREWRRLLGQYHTPSGVAALAVEELAVDDWATATVLDPGCGAGAFLVACIERTLAALGDDRDPAATVEHVTDTVYGIDLDPLAVRSAELAYLLALSSPLAESDVDTLAVPVVHGDALGLDPEAIPEYRGEPFAPTVDHLVGNPPWITWSSLPESVKAAWRERDADGLELVPHGGARSRLGHANDDVSVPFVWVCLDRYLAPGGDASVVLKRGLMKGPAGAVLRRQRVGDRDVAVRYVHDFGSCRPFGDAVDAGAAVYALSADDPPDGPIPATTWTVDAATPAYGSLPALARTHERERTAFVPVGDDPGSAWVRRDAERRALGECAHEIRHGLKDDAKAVFAVDRDRLADLDADLVYPYLKSRHVVKYGLFGHDLQIVPQQRANEDNEATLREEYPRTYAYLDEHRERLKARSSSWLEAGPFYSVFGLGEYTWAPYKLTWCRLGFKPHFAVVSTVEDPDLGEKPVVPGDHCMFVATDDREQAHFLCALCNSAPYQATIRDLAGDGKAGLSKAVVSELALPAYDGGAASRRLAALSIEAHDIVPEHTDVSKRTYNDRTIDELAAVQARIDATVESMLADDRGPFGGD